MTDFTNTLIMVRRRAEHAKALGAREIWLGLDEAAGLMMAVDDAVASADQLRHALDLMEMELARTRAMAKDLVGVRA